MGSKRQSAAAQPVLPPEVEAARSGSLHGDVRSDSGALVFIRTASGVIPHAPDR